jgi:hypothetical protein
MHQLFGLHGGDDGQVRIGEGGMGSHRAYRVDAGRHLAAASTPSR